MTRVEPSAFPGALGVLLEEGLLPRATPGFDELCARAPSTRQFTTASGHLERVGWPLRNEVVLARLAIGKREETLAAGRETLAAVDKWLAGGDTSRAQLRVAWQCADARFWRNRSGASEGRPDSPLDELLPLFRKLHPDASPEACKLLVDPDLRPESDPDAPYLIAQLAFAAEIACEGWLAYYVHRSLTSPASDAAANVIRIVCPRAPGLWSELVARARELLSGSI